MVTPFALQRAYGFNPYRKAHLYLLDKPELTYPKAFPLRGRCHGRAVTDEVETRCGFAGNQQKRGIAPHTSSVSLRSTASPQGEAMSAPMSVHQIPIFRTDKGALLYGYVLRMYIPCSAIPNKDVSLRRIATIMHIKNGVTAFVTPF